MFVAASPLEHIWPDGIDWTVTSAYLGLIVALVVVGSLSMSLHVRDYLRSLRRALVVISQYRLELPGWIREDRPRCIEALGLTLPCTTEDVLTAYRRKVKLLHPDRGGDTREFLRLQAYFEQAMALVAKE